MPGSAARGQTIVWIDAREAIVLRWEIASDGRAGPRIDRHRLDVPPHERSVGHVRHDPLRHGGGREQTRIETHRLEHLRRGLAIVAAAVPRDDDVLVLGPGPVREHLAAALHDGTVRMGRGRAVRVEAAGRLSEAQLVARLRELVGMLPPRVR